MKKSIVVLSILLFSAAAFAQPNDARFDADLKRLNRRFESVESIKRLEKDANTAVRLERAITSAENELGRFKEKYPEHDISKFESALAGFKDPNSTSESSSSPNPSNSAPSDFAKVENFVETIDEILDLNPPVAKFIRNEDGALEETKQQLADFRLKMDKAVTPEFLALAKDVSNRKIKRIADKANRDAKSMETRLSGINLEQIQSETKENLMLSKYFLIVFTQEQLKYLSRIFGNDDNIAGANALAGKMIAKLGTVEDIEKRGKANYAAKVAEHRMFPERQNNAALRSEATRAFNSSIYRANVKGNTVLKVHLVSGGWSVERNQLTGIILSRDQLVHIAYKASDGKCYTYLMTMQQKHLGGGRYGSGFDRSGSTLEILCENVPK
ncbi:MAG: hypothetical protein R2681_18300 [Pyrinomonadaceae bacterium]